MNHPQLNAIFRFLYKTHSKLCRFAEDTNDRKQTNLALSAQLDEFGWRTEAHLSFLLYNSLFQQGSISMEILLESEYFSKTTQH